MLRVLYTLAGLGLLTSAHAEDLHLPADRYWVAMASRQSLEEAIAVARQLASLQPMVVRSVNGWYAVVKGPQDAGQGSGRAVLDEMIRSQGVPHDAYFTRGDGYTEVVWTTPAGSSSPVLATKSYDGKTNATLVSADLRIELSKLDGGQGPIARGFHQGKPAFTITADDHPSAAPAATVSVVYLDQSSPSPQVVFTYSWQAAQCCTVTKIATLRNDGTWAIVNGELTGSGGYAFEHLSSPGSIEMTSRDQAFSGIFASHAESVAPIRIHKLIVDQLVDVTEDPQYKDHLLQALNRIEAAAKADARLWHNNGFLAGWVAAKMLAGQGPDAWPTMLKSYDRTPDFGPQECLTGRATVSCPDDKRVRVDFPIALKAFLVEHGYIRDANLYPVPSRRLSERTTLFSASLSPAMSRCIGSSDAARTLIYQSFVGRRIRGDENSSLVMLQNDTTVEATEPAIGRVVCAVSYDMNLRSLIDRLAGGGEVQRAALLAQLMRRAGPTASKRVKYSIKPTATQGQIFVELLP